MANGCFSILIKGFAPNWDNTDSGEIRYIFALVDSQNNRYKFSYRGGGIFELGRDKLGNYEGGQSFNLTIKKFQCINFLIEQTKTKIRIRGLINGGTVFKYEKEFLPLGQGEYKLYLLQAWDNYNQADAFYDDFLVMHRNFEDDALAERILRGQEQGFENNNMIKKFDEINRDTGIKYWNLHPKSNGIISNEGKTLTINVTENYTSSGFNIMILPNNRYRLQGNTTGYYRIDEYYNNYVLKTDAVLKTGNVDYIYTPSSDKVNNIYIYCTNENKGKGVYTFDLPELRRLD